MQGYRAVCLLLSPRTIRGQGRAIGATNGAGGTGRQSHPALHHRQQKRRRRTKTNGRWEQKEPTAGGRPIARPAELLWCRMMSIEVWPQRENFHRSGLPCSAPLNVREKSRLTGSTDSAETTLDYGCASFLENVRSLSVSLIENHFSLSLTDSLSDPVTW